MILMTLASIFLNGFAILVGILSVMRLLYRFGICEPPRNSNDPVEYCQMPISTSRHGRSDRRSVRDFEMNGLAGDDVVFGIGQLKKDRVDSWSQSNNDDSLTTCIDKVPRSIVDGDMYMTDSRRHGHRTLAKYR
jgi:hypothetical protein